MKIMTISMILEPTDQMEVEVLHGLPALPEVRLSATGVLGVPSIYMTAQQLDHLILTAVAAQRELDAMHATHTPLFDPDNPVGNDTGDER